MSVVADHGQRLAVAAGQRAGRRDVLQVGDDDVARGEKELESLTRANVDAVDEALKRKEAELLEV